MKFDPSEVSTLLHIVEACAQHGNRLSAIGSEALKALTDLNNEIRATAVDAGVVTPVAPAPVLADGEAVHTADNANPNLTDRRI